VFTDEGSPLLFHTRNQSKALQALLAEQGQGNVVVDFAMRYGNPSIPSVLESMFNKGVRKLLVLPLYPQYSGSTAASTFDAIAKDFTTRRWIPDLRFVSHYHDYTPFIDAAAKRIEEHWQTHGRADKLMFSFHGVPMRYLHNGDPYHCECLKSGRLLGEALGLVPGQYIVTFQSRFGPQEWLQPYTDKTLEKLPTEGKKNVLVICPGFSADCVETLEEIAIQGKESFLEKGGENYDVVPCLNDNDDHIKMMEHIVKKYLIN
jgi:ferrochelatase